MFIPTEEQMQKAIDIAGNEMPTPVGYRTLVKPLPVDRGMKAGDAQLAPELEKAGFLMTSKDQAERETKGSDRCIVCHVGDNCYSGDHLSSHAPWVKEGDIAVLHRYTGLTIAIPDGSDNFYRICNDEDFFAVYEENLNV